MYLLPQLMYSDGWLANGLVLVSWPCRQPWMTDQGPNRLSSFHCAHFGARSRITYRHSVGNARTVSDIRAFLERLNFESNGNLPGLLQTRELLPRSRPGVTQQHRHKEHLRADVDEEVDKLHQSFRNDER